MEKNLLENEDGFTTIWQWACDRGLSNTVGLQNAFDFAMDMKNLESAKGKISRRLKPLRRSKRMPFQMLLPRTGTRLVMLDGSTLPPPPKPLMRNLLSLAPLPRSILCGALSLELTLLAPCLPLTLHGILPLELMSLAHSPTFSRRNLSLKLTSVPSLHFRRSMSRTFFVDLALLVPRSQAR